jgi:hypothetical protein
VTVPGRVARDTRAVSARLGTPDLPGMLLQEEHAAAWRLAEAEWALAPIRELDGGAGDGRLEERVAVRGVGLFDGSAIGGQGCSDRHRGADRVDPQACALGRSLATSACVKELADGLAQVANLG